MGPGDLWLAPTPGLTYPGTESPLPLGLIPAADRAELRLWLTSFTDPGAREEADLYESSCFLSPTEKVVILPLPLSPALPLHT